MYFEVKGSHGSAVKSFSIRYCNNECSLSAVENYRDIIAIGLYGWVKREDGSYCKQSMGLCCFKQGSKGYELLTDLFNNIKRLDFSTYDGKEFCHETFSPFIKGMRNLDSQRTTEDASTIGSTTTELFNSSQLKESATEELDYEVQEDSEYFAVEPAPLKQQKLDLAPGETTEEIKHIMEEIRSSNARLCGQNFREGIQELRQNSENS